MDMQKRWKYFLKTIKDDTLELSAVIEKIKVFLEPIYYTMINNSIYEKKWNAKEWEWK